MSRRPSRCATARSVAGPIGPGPNRLCGHLSPLERTVLAMAWHIIDIYCVLRLDIERFDASNGRPLSDANASGFVLGYGEPHQNFLVTNRHVVDPKFRGKTHERVSGVRVRGHFQPQSEASQRPQPLDFRVVSPTFRFHPNPQVDLAVIAGQADWIQNPGITTLNEDFLPTVSHLERHLRPGGELVVPGFPSVGGEVGSRPILATGFVSSDPRYPATLGGQTLDHSVLCHGFSWGGMSGAPVFALLKDNICIVGVNAGHIDFQGAAGGVISHFVRIDRLIELFVAQRQPFFQGYLT